MAITAALYVYISPWQRSMFIATPQALLIAIIVPVWLHLCNDFIFGESLKDFRQNYKKEI